MAKFHGNIGFTEQYQSKPGVFTERIIEREYYGNTLESRFNANTTSDKVNDDLVINNKISVVANDYAFRNFHFMKYIVYMGVKWEIKSVEVQYPRLILSIGGVYNA